MSRVCRTGGRVVVVDLVPPTPDVLDRFDEVHRLLDPSHAGAITEIELAELLTSRVGSVTYAERSDPLTLALEMIFTGASDRGAVRAALDDELDGGPATGFSPTFVDNHLHVSFHTVVIHASKPDVAGTPLG